MEKAISVRKSECVAYNISINFDIGLPDTDLSVESGTIKPRICIELRSNFVDCLGIQSEPRGPTSSSKLLGFMFRTTDWIS